MEKSVPIEVICEEYGKNRCPHLCARSYGTAMDSKLLRARELCFDQAQGFIEAAGRLGADWPHIVYHLSLLALEELARQAWSARG